VCPDEDRFWPVLTALEGNQSEIEEHFTDEDVADLATCWRSIQAVMTSMVNFRLEDLGGKFLAPLRVELLKEGVQLENEPCPQSAPEQSDSSRD